jgi:hypothetical protein
VASRSGANEGFSSLSSSDVWEYKSLNHAKRDWHAEMLRPVFRLQIEHIGSKGVRLQGMLGAKRIVGREAKCRKGDVRKLARSWKFG